MTLPFHGKHERREPVPVVYASVPPDEEVAVPVAMRYDHFATITLQGTLFSLRQAVRVHGETERTRAIERGIVAELERRGETV